MKCDYSPDQVERLVSARYVEKEGGFSCGNCNYFKSGDCDHPEIQARVKMEGICVKWDGESDFTANECKKE